MHQKFDVTGMSCAACSAHVDKSVRGLDGVNDVNVNLLNNNMVVDFDEDKVSVNDIINAVIKHKEGRAAQIIVETGMPQNAYLVDVRTPSSISNS